MASKIAVSNRELAEAICEAIGIDPTETMIIGVEMRLYAHSAEEPAQVVITALLNKDALDLPWDKVLVKRHLTSIKKKEVQD